MENFLPKSGTNNGGKLQGSERGFSFIVGLAGLLFVGWLAIKVFPLITESINNTADMVWAAIKLSLYVVGTILAIVGAIKLWPLFSYWWNVIIKLTWGAMIEANPIAGMQYAYDKWADEAEALNGTITVLEGKESYIKGKLDSRGKEATQYFASGQKAKEMAQNATGDDATDLNDTAESNAIMAQRRKESIDMLIPKLQTIQAALDFSRKLHTSWLKGLSLLKDDIEIKKDDLDILKSISSAFEKARSIISGTSNERVIYEQAVIAYSKQVGDYVGKCKRFTEMAKDYAVNTDVQNALASDMGQKYLNTYDTKSFNELVDYKTIMKASPTRLKVQQSMAQSANSFSANIQASANVTSNNDFSQLG